MIILERQEIRAKILEIYPGVYLEDHIERVVDGIVSYDAEVRDRFEKFLETGDVPDFSVEGYSVEKLMGEHGFNGVAAFQTLDWLKREPEKAKESLSKGRDQISTPIRDHYDDEDLPG